MQRKKHHVGYFPGVIRFSYLLFSCFFSLFLHGQSNLWTVERMGLEEILGSSGVKGIAQDRYGYLWIGTNNGVARYDGYTIINYESIVDDSTTLNHNRTSYVYVDHYQEIWVGTAAGLNRFLPDCNCFKRYTIDPKHPNTIPDGEINSMVEDSDQQLWIASQNGGLYRYDRPTDSFIRHLYRPEDSLSLAEDEVRVLLADQEGNIWAGTGETFVPTIAGGGLIRYSPKTGTARRFLHNPRDSNSLIDNRVSALLQDSRGRIWVGSCDSGVQLYDPAQEYFIRMVPGESEIYAPQAASAPWSACPHIRVLHEDQAGGIWVGNFNAGLYRFDLETGQRQSFHYQENNPNSLKNELIWDFFEDNQGRFWVGNMSGGLTKIDPFQKKFSVSLLGLRITGIYSPSSNPRTLLLGSPGAGIYRQDIKTLEIDTIQKPTKGEEEYRIRKFLEDDSGRIWIASDQGLDQLDLKNKHIRHVPILVKGEMEANDSYSLMDIGLDHQGNLWLGSWAAGLLRYNETSRQFEKYPLPYLGAGEGNTMNQSVYVVHEDSLNRLWLGTWLDGLYHFDPQNESFVHYLPGIGLNTLYEYAAGHFWVGSNDHGLIEFIPEKGIIRSFTTKDGLSGNKVFGILADGAGKLWISTNSGLSHFDPETAQFHNFQLSDGLPSMLFSDFSSWKDEDGRMHLGTAEGLVSFHPENLQRNPFPPKALIQNVKIFERDWWALDPTQQLALTLPETLELPYDQNELTFEYVGLHYSRPELNTYQVQLIPYDRAWKQVGTNRTIRYTNLNPGTYQFKVKAANQDGVWSPEEAILTINIAPPWWKTWWAYLIYALLLGLIVAGIYRFQRRRWALQTNLQIEQEKLQRLQELDEFKSRFYTNITHEFRTPLTIIQGLVDQIQEHPGLELPKRLDMIHRNSQSLLQLINQLLDLSKLEAGHLRWEPVQGNVMKFLSYVVESFQSLGFINRMTISFHAEAEDLVMDYDPEKLQLILTNLIANAVKFTPEYGKVSIVAAARTASNDPEFLEIKVRDTGTGIAKEKLPFIFDRFYQADTSSVRTAEGTGLGLALVKELVKLMNGQIRVESELDRGTIFYIELPISRSALVADDLQLTSKTPTIEYVGHNPKIETRESTASDLPMILLVEDNQDVIYYLRSCLSGQYRIEEAKDGRLGVAKALELIPDLVVSDVMMPETDGFELCETLKKDERTSHIPIVLLTAKVTQADKLMGLQYGADAYLIKPFQKEELLLRLEKLIELRRKLQHKYQTTDFRKSVTSAASKETAFLAKMEKVVAEHLHDPDFTIAHLCHYMKYSRVQIHRKLKALTGLSTSQFIRSRRLHKGRALLLETDLTISEIAYQVGFSDPSYFSRTYVQLFNEAPSETRN